MTLKEYLHSLSSDARLRLARGLDTTDAYLKKLMYVPASKPSPELALKIEVLSCGKITRAQMRPELYVGMVSIAKVSGGNAFPNICVPCRVSRPDLAGTFESSDIESSQDVSIQVKCGIEGVSFDLPDGSWLAFNAEQALCLSVVLTRCSAAHIARGDVTLAAIPRQ